MLCKLRVPVFVFLAILGSSIASAKDQATVLREIHQYYNSISALSASFDQMLQHRESGSTEHRKGELFFKKTLNLRWEVTSPSKEQWIVTEQDIWDFLPDEEVAYRYSAQNIKNSGGILGLLTGQTSLDQDYDINFSGEDGGFTQLQLFPKEASMQLVEAKIWVDDEGAVRKVRSVDFYGNVNEITLAQLRKNPNLKQSLFIFKAPQGTEIEDLRNADMQKGIFQ